MPNDSGEAKRKLSESYPLKPHVYASFMEIKIFGLLFLGTWKNLPSLPLPLIKHGVPWIYI